MIKICNLRTEKIEYAYDVRVDRTNKILGNPFFMKNEDMRDEVCIKYRAWIKEKLLNKDEVVINELKRIYGIYKQYGKLRLFCWCAPKRCHAETIKELIELKDKKERN